MQNKILLCLFFLTTRLDCQELFPPNQAAIAVIADGNPMFDNPVNGARRAQQDEARKKCSNKVIELLHLPVWRSD
ncbi:MAG: hypothetical protein LVQ75_01945 [Candidatus Babeliales bacterium]|jgi:hypothetical protein